MFTRLEIILLVDEQLQAVGACDSGEGTAGGDGSCVRGGGIAVEATVGGAAARGSGDGGGVRGGIGAAVSAVDGAAACCVGNGGFGGSLG